MASNDITYEQFIAHLDKGKKVYMKKPGSWQKGWYWWESKREKWFLNKAYEQRNNKIVTKERSSWILAPQSKTQFMYMERLGYKYNINE